MAISSIYITFPTKDEADKIINTLFQERLIACANLSPVESLYWWNGEIINEGEWAAMAKTTDDLWDTLKAKVCQLHSYEVPCIVRHQVDANTEYESWVRDMVCTLD